ncbi:tRNA (guanine(10)-N2)-methyltransferase homolog [Trichogramma pretiosum]|uniref:tRNA (guanine(10)-N2)-methyltransferase homolog n=1 Tax=Trichogramma pretiosum TaxID=7493 RepID=UPI000C719BB1|nr:tRNA (guanine(10)-N2)-methyltransferase homolog [Trichogramma pretiosum]
MSQKFRYKNYLLWFAQEHVDFRVAEMDSIFGMFNIKCNSIVKNKIHPFWVVQLDSEDDARKIASRSILLRYIIELWAFSTDLSCLNLQLQTQEVELVSTHMSSTFKIIVETFGKHFTQKEKIDKIENFKYLPYKGTVSLKDPDKILYYIEYYGLDANNVPEKPENVFFGRWITDGQRNLMKELSLKQRKFIGNTSMDPQLSVIMVNQTKAKEGDIILDPFVGTGSVLISAAKFGAYTLGADIDYQTLHARTRPSRITQKVREKDESVAANMKQYGIQDRYLDVIVSDFTKSAWRPCFQIDAIVTDPPYGIRESVEKIGTTKDSVSISEEQADSHIPSKVDYALPHLFKDLLNFAAEHLKMDGRVVFWFPIFRKTFTSEQLPVHPCLELVANSEQVLSSHSSRLLLTYEKTKEVESDDPPCVIGEDNFRDLFFNEREEKRKVRRARKCEERARMKREWEKRVMASVSSEDSAS